MGTESRRQELMKLCGLCDEALRELEAAAGSGGEDYEERIGLAAAMKQAGFSAEEIRTYFGRKGKRPLPGWIICCIRRSGTGKFSGSS